jgi:hypothetical protein
MSAAITADQRLHSFNQILSLGLLSHLKNAPTLDKCQKLILHFWTVPELQNQNSSTKVAGAIEETQDRD